MIHLEVDHMLSSLKTKVDVLIKGVAGNEPNVISAIVTVLGNVMSDVILELCKGHIREKGYNSILYNCISDNEITKATALLNNAELSGVEI